MFGLFSRKKESFKKPDEPSEEAGELLISGFDTTGIETMVPDFEKRLKTNLPPQYRAFLLKYNGGKTPNTNFRIGEISSDLRALYGLGSAERRYHFDEHRGTGYRKQGMLLIGENAWGDYVALKISGADAGGVYFLYHDRMPQTFLPLTKDFAEFAAACESRPLQVRTLEERRAALRERGKEPTPELEAIWKQEIQRLLALCLEPVIL